MKTNEQIAERAAEQISLLPQTYVRIMDIREKAKPIILAALNESATPQWDESKAVDWPTEPGLWLAFDGRQMQLVDVYVGCDPHFRPVPVGKSGNHVLLRRDNWRFCGPINLPLPAPPAEPDPWDYEPQDGEYVWSVTPNGAHVSERPHRCKVVDERVFIGPIGYLSEAREHGYRFAKATIEPPPAIGGGK